ncbi:MAG: DNA primase [Clostridia bacterium]|nr:DNA primase [Clostridia bacterium]
MPRYPSAWLEELRARSDIVQVVSAYVPLKKSGRHHWGLCPFHGEKTASFSVDGERQLFYCFGCKAGGDVFHFVSEIERCSFSEAVQLLADRAHMDVPEMEESEEYRRQKSQRERLMLANKTAARFYHETLFKPAGAASLAYLRKRGLTDQVIRRFGLGAAPDAWSALTDHLLQEGFTLEELRLAGLTVIKEPEKGSDGKSGKRRAFDMFRNRAIFPIIDMYGNVLAFGGRALGNQQPKYLNTSDTPVFNKRKGVYAANLLRKQRHLDRVILVEGYMDVVSLSQFGVEGVCATLGTALTNEQAQLMRRFAPQVYLGYDGDSAGQHAILRGLGILEEEGIPARVLDFPDGLDPDEYIRRDGLAGFQKLPAISPAAYRLRRLRADLDLSTAEGRITYAREAAKVLRSLDPVERDSFLKELMVQTGFSRETLLEQMNLPGITPATVQERPRPARLNSGREAPASEDVTAQELLLSLIAGGQIPRGMAEEEDFTDEELLGLYRDLMAGASVPSLIDRAADDEARARYTRVLMTPEAEDKDQMIAMANDCVLRIRKNHYNRRLKELETLLTNTSPEEQGQLLQEAMELNTKIKKLSALAPASKHD